MATPAVGEDIEALCGRCGQVWHVVMAKMGERIAKVVCKRCGGHHGYRTEKIDGAEAAPNGARDSRRPAPRRYARRAAEPSAPVMPPFDPSKPPRPYTAKETFGAGERLTHPAFGTGVVTGTPGPGKIEIAFPAGVRVLACAKAVSTLERPHTVSNAPISDRPPKLPQP
ncbi:MAG TPA: hypothetical protein VFH68_27200 [Polyangia bacterium]|jgi:hypothetical protein|nr:hypothetical protein [Polyangia bacterium]